MRKSSKLLAVLLTLCLLFGAITAIFASADGEAQDPFNVTQRTGYTYKDTLTCNSTTKYFYVENKSKLPYVEDCDVEKISGVTVDFDINPELVTDGVAVPFQLRLSGYAEGATTANDRAFQQLSAFYIKLLDGQLFMTLNKDATTGVSLPEDSEGYSHITIVLYHGVVTKNDVETEYMYQNLFVNGDFALSAGAIKPTRALNRLGAFQCTGLTGEDAIVFDNIAVNHYAADDTTLAPYKIAPSPCSIYDAEKVVYKDSYAMPGSETKYVELSTGEHFYAPVAGAIGAKITDGATVTVKGMNIPGVDNIPFNVESFTVVTEDGGSFSLSEASLRTRFEKSVNEDGNDVYTNKQFVMTDDCNETKDSYVIGSDNTSNTALGFAYNNSAKSRHIRVSYVNSSYVRVHYDKDNGLYGDTAIDFVAGSPKHYEREAEIVWRPYAYYEEETDLKNYKYFTIDFDFCSDAYAYTFVDGEKTYYATATSEAEAIAKLASEQNVTLNDGYTFTSRLAYPTDLTFKPQFQTSNEGVLDNSQPFTVSSGNAYWAYELTGVLNVASDSEGQWYIEAGATEAKANLSNEPGVFNHITYVFEISVTDGVLSAVPHIYVNGEFLSTGGAMNGIGLYDHFQQLIIDYYANKRTTFGDRMYDKYSLAFDNMAVAYYDVSDLAKTTLDESMEDKEPLYTLDGVVYNAEYVVPNQDGYITLDGKNYYIFNAAWNKAEGKTVNLHNVKIENYVANLESFTVICDGNSTFTLDAAKCWGYYETAGETGTTYTKVIGPNDLKIGLDLSSGSMDLRFYFPHREGLTMTAASYSSVNKYINKPATVNGVEYITAYWKAPLFNLTSSYETNFTFKYVAEGIDITLTSPTIQFGVLSYATEVANIFPCGSEEAQLVKAIVDYRVAFNAFIDEGFSTPVQNAIKKFNAIYEEHGEGCTCLTYVPEDNDSDVKYIEVGAVSDDKSANAITTFIQSGNYFGLKITAAENSTVRLTYSSVNRQGGEYTRTETSTSGYVIFTNIEAADIDNDITITITTPAAEEGGEATVNIYNFCLANYIAACEEASSSTTLTEEQKAEFAKVLPVVRALANYALAAENYKVYVTE